MINILFIGGCLKLSAQVTIGSDLAPNEGAILDLKENTATTPGGANATRGMILPRVKLTDINFLADIIPNDSDRPDPILHEGLMVFNMNEDLCTTPVLNRGVHVWSGSKWIFLKKKD